MMPSKNYNLIMPFTTYRELKKMSAQHEKPIAGIVRAAIAEFLQNVKSEKQVIVGE